MVWGDEEAAIKALASSLTRDEDSRKRRRLYGPKLDCSRLRSSSSSKGSKGSRGSSTQSCNSEPRSGSMKQERRLRLEQSLAIGHAQLTVLLRWEEGTRATAAKWVVWLFKMVRKASCSPLSLQIMLFSWVVTILPRMSRSLQECRNLKGSEELLLVADSILKCVDKNKRCFSSLQVAVLQCRLADCRRHWHRCLVASRKLLQHALSNELPPPAPPTGNFLHSEELWSQWHPGRNTLPPIRQQLAQEISSGELTLARWQQGAPPHVRNALLGPAQQLALGGSAAVNMPPRHVITIASGRLQRSSVDFGFAGPGPPAGSRQVSQPVPPGPISVGDDLFADMAFQTLPEKSTLPNLPRRLPFVTPPGTSTRREQDQTGRDADEACWEWRASPYCCRGGGSTGPSQDHQALEPDAAWSSREHHKPLPTQHRSPRGGHLYESKLSDDLIRTDGVEVLLSRAIDCKQQSHEKEVESILLGKGIYTGGRAIGPAGVSLSLVCPLSGQRLQVPARSKHCTHGACFDLRVFLQRQLARATSVQTGSVSGCHMAGWDCPVCGADASWHDLVVDGFLLQIVEKLLLDVLEILLFPDATWKAVLGVSTSRAEGNGQLSPIRGGKGPARIPSPCGRDVARLTARNPVPDAAERPPACQNSAVQALSAVCAGGPARRPSPRNSSGTLAGAHATSLGEMGSDSIRQRRDGFSLPISREDPWESPVLWPRTGGGCDTLRPAPPRMALTPGGASFELLPSGRSLRQPPAASGHLMMSRTPAPSPREASGELPAWQELSPSLPDSSLLPSFRVSDSHLRNLPSAHSSLLDPPLLNCFLSNPHRSNSHLSSSTASRTVLQFPDFPCRDLGVGPSTAEHVPSRQRNLAHELSPDVTQSPRPRQTQPSSRGKEVVHAWGEMGYEFFSQDEVISGIVDRSELSFRAAQVNDRVAYRPYSDQHK